MAQLHIVKIGDKTRPATEEDIEFAEKALKELLAGRESNKYWVTHHAVEVQSVYLDTIDPMYPTDSFKVVGTMFDLAPVEMEEEPNE